MLYTRAFYAAMFTILYIQLVHTCPTSGHLFCVFMCKFKIRDWDIITVHISLSVHIEESCKWSSDRCCHLWWQIISSQNLGVMRIIIMFRQLIYKLVITLWKFLDVSWRRNTGKSSECHHVWGVSELSIMYTQLLHHLTHTAHTYTGFNLQNKYIYCT